MGLEFLARVRHSTLGVATVVALAVATYGSLPHGLAVAAGAVWSIANLALLQLLVTALTGPQRRDFAGIRNAGGAVLGMLALFAAGAFLLVKAAPGWLMVGFAIPFAVMLLKALSVVLLESRAWKWLTASAWRAAFAVAILVFAAWWVIPNQVHSQGSSPAPAPVTAAAGHSNAPPTQTAAAGEQKEKESGPQKFANVITVLERAFPEAGWAKFLHTYEVVIFALLVGLILCVVSFVASRNPQMVPSGLQNVVELLVEKLYEFIKDIIGDRHAERFVPFLGTLGIYIWFMNLFGLIPFMDSPTSSLNITFALGLIVFVYVQYVGMRELGFIGYFDHMLGQPRDVTGWLLAPLMLPIHVLGELAKPISLSCRLFGNIFGEDMLLVAFVSLGITALPFAKIPFGLPLQVPFLVLALLTSTLQAAVFMVLSTIYILLMLPHDEHGHEGDLAEVHAHPNHHAPAAPPAHP